MQPAADRSQFAQSRQQHRLATATTTSATIFGEEVARPWPLHRTPSQPPRGRPPRCRPTTSRASAPRSAAPGCCPARRTTTTRSSTGSARRSSTATGSRSPARKRWPSPAASSCARCWTRACSWSAAGTTRSARSTTCAATGGPRWRNATAAQAVRFQCPYHAWIYDLDGKLIRAKHTEDLEDFTLRGLRPGAHPDRDLAGLRVPVLRRRVGHARARGVHGRLVRAPRGLRPRLWRACARAARLTYDVGGQLEDRGRELLRVLPLPGRPSAAQQAARPTTWARTSWPRARGRAAGCRSPRAARRCR